MSADVRVIPGPRTAAYYAVLDARAGQGDHDRRDRRDRDEGPTPGWRTHRAPRPLGFPDSSSGVIYRGVQIDKDHDDRELGKHLIVRYGFPLE